MEKVEILENYFQVQKEVTAAMEQNLDNHWFRDFSGLELTSNTVVLKAKVYSSNYFFV
jgi:hypothetical protein